jgi:hypothetical protein
MNREGELALAVRHHLEPAGTPTARPAGSATHRDLAELFDVER